MRGRWGLRVRGCLSLYFMSPSSNLGIVFPVPLPRRRGRDSEVRALVSSRAGFGFPLWSASLPGWGSEPPRASAFHHGEDGWGAKCGAWTSKTG